jgi:hypothetical protein
MNTKYLSIVFIAAATILSSCKNNDNVFPKVVSSFFSVVNASADTLNFFLNGSRQNNLSNLYPDGTTGYLAVPAGMQNYQFKKAGGFAVLFSVPLNLKDSTNNSLFVTGETANDAFFIADNIDTLTNFSTVRFVNASPDAGNLTVSVGDTVSFKTMAFKSSSGFLPVNSGTKEIKVFLAGATTPKIDTVVTMQSSRAYTVFSKGLLNGKGNSVFDVGLILSF